LTGPHKPISFSNHYKQEATMVPSSHGGRFGIRTVDGLELVAERHGNQSGPEIVLVHGLGQSSLSWSRQTEGLLAETCHLVAYDLRGHGNSSKPDSLAAYEDAALWADDLHAVIEAAGFRRPIVVGWSLGALVAGHYLLRYGHDRVAAVNVVGAVTKLAPELLGVAALAHRDPLASPDLATRCDAVASFLSACFAVPPPEAEFRRMLAFNAMVPREMHQAVGRIGHEGLDEAWAAVPRLLATWGDEDRHVRREMSARLLALNPAARLSVYEGAAHAPFYERSERFNRELAAFAAG
jgi:non-heme chloroperoxidase